MNDVNYLKQQYEHYTKELNLLKDELIECYEIMIEYPYSVSKFMKNRVKATEIKEKMQNLDTTLAKLKYDIETPYI